MVRNQIAVGTLVGLAYGALVAVLAPHVGGFAAVFATPGVVLTLPLHNAVEQWWWAVSLIVAVNALFYAGLGAVVSWLVAKLKARSP